MADAPGSALFLLAGLAVAFAETAGAPSGRTVDQVLKQGAATLLALAPGDEPPASV